MSTENQENAGASSEETTKITEETGTSTGAEGTEQTPPPVDPATPPVADGSETPPPVVEEKPEVAAIPPVTTPAPTPKEIRDAQKQQAPVVTPPVEQASPKTVSAEEALKVAKAAEVFPGITNPLTDYVKAMSVGSKALTFDQGFKNQQALLGVYNQLLLIKPDKFDQALRQVLRIIAENSAKGQAFDVSRPFRFLTNGELPSQVNRKGFSHNEYLFFTRFTSFLQSVAAPEGRELAVKQYQGQLPLIFQGIKEDKYSRFYEFFNLANGGA